MCQLFLTSDEVLNQSEFEGTEVILGGDDTEAINEIEG